MARKSRTAVLKRQREVKKAVKDDPDLKRAIKALTTRAAQTIAEAL